MNLVNPDGRRMTLSDSPWPERHETLVTVTEVSGISWEYLVRLRAVAYAAALTPTWEVAP